MVSLPFPGTMSLLIVCSAIFQAGGLIVVLVEVGRKAYLASIVPVIVNAILNEHQIVVDIVAFVNKGDFPRSRLGEKQRGKILASWVTRKMRTMAQFGIRDAESGLSDVTEAIEPRSSMRNSSVMGSSLRNVEPAPQIIEEREAEQHQPATRDSYVPAPVGVAEMPAQLYDKSGAGSVHASASTYSDDTPTDKQKAQSELPGDGLGTERGDLPEIPDSSFMVPGLESDEPPPRKPSKPNVRQSVILPAVEGREGDLWSLPSQQAAGGHKVKNSEGNDEEDDSWKDDAIMHMNLAAS
jgi:hypothetical protein